MSATPLRSIFSFDLDERRTAHIPAASWEEASEKLNAYLDSTDDEARFHFELKYIEYVDDETDEDAEEEEAFAVLVRAILIDGLDTTPAS